MPIRTTSRLFRLLLVLSAGLTVAFLFPLFPASTRLALKQRWARAVLDALDIRVHDGPHGTGEIATGTLLVANHVSWLDVLAISAVRPACFVCKHEVAAWPVLGWLIARTGALFIRRASVRGAARATHETAEMLRTGASVAVFPEGTTTGGDGVLPFRPMFFQAAIAAGCPIQPVAVRYSNPAAAFVGDTNFMDSLLAIASARELAVSVGVLAPLAMLTRRQAAARAEQSIRAALARDWDLLLPACDPDDTLELAHDGEGAF